MKEKIIIVFLLVLVGACKSDDARSVYMDSSGKYYLSMEKSSGGDTLYMLYDGVEPTKVKAFGFVKDDLRNDVWTYNLDQEEKTIKWGHFKDKNLGFETNVFAHIDSVTYGDFFTKFLFKTNDDKIILNVAINSFFKDSLPQINYKRLTENEFAQIGFEPSSFKSRKMVNGHNEIYLNEIKGKFIKTNEVKIIKNAFCFLDESHFVDYSVIYSKENNVDAAILFNAVLTNFFLNGKRLFDPLVPSAVTYPDWEKK
jgi:hypothetical protein